MRSITRTLSEPARSGHLPRVLVSAHVSEVYGPVQALRAHLLARRYEARFLTHPFPYTGIWGSVEERLSHGKVAASIQRLSRRSLAPLQFALNFFSALGLGWGGGPKAQIYIGIGNLNALAGLLLRALGRVEQVGYYVIDHTDGRFGNPFLNAIYHWVDGVCCRRCDFLWCLSERIAKAKQARGAAPQRCLDCPVGVQLEEVVPASATKRRPHVLVVMSHLTQEKGVQLVLDSFAEIARKHPRARLEVIGTGPYEAELKAQAARLKLGKVVRFLGLMGHAQLFRHLPTCGISLATYTEHEDNIAYYADPTKPKEYLACGLPLIITKVPWTWEAVANKKKPMGVAIRYTQAELVAAADKLLGDRAFYAKCRRNALAFAATLAWGKIFDKAFAQATGLRA